MEPYFRILFEEVIKKKGLHFIFLSNAAYIDHFGKLVSTGIFRSLEHSRKKLFNENFSTLFRNRKQVQTSFICHFGSKKRKLKFVVYKSELYQ